MHFTISHPIPFHWGKIQAPDSTVTGPVKVIQIACNSLQWTTHFFRRLQAPEERRYAQTETALCSLCKVRPLNKSHLRMKIRITSVKQNKKKTSRWSGVQDFLQWCVCSFDLLPTMTLPNWGKFPVKLQEKKHKCMFSGFVLDLFCVIY